VLSLIFFLMKKIELSIIIVNYNTEKELTICLTSIARNRLNIDYEIIIVDNGSDRASLKKIERSFDIRIVQNLKNVGFARAVNQGIYRSKGEYILILNPDTIVEETTIQTLLDYIRTKKDAGCVGPQIFYSDGRHQPSLRRFPTFVRVFFGRQSVFRRFFPQNPITRSYFYLDIDYRNVQKVDWVTGACFMTRKSVLDKVGLFDERFFLYVEDADFCYRLNQSNYAVYYVPDAKIVHTFGSATNRFWQHSIISHNVGMLKFFEKHYHLNLLLRGLLFWGLILRIFYISLFYTLMDHLRDIGFIKYQDVKGV